MRQDTRIGTKAQTRQARAKISKGKPINDPDAAVPAGDTKAEERKDELKFVAVGVSDRKRKEVPTCCQG
jgi:hypothetical protein